MYKRGDIYMCDLGKREGSIQGNKRPVVILSNNIGNKYSPVVLVAVITSKQTKAKLPTHVNIDLYKPSIILTEQLFTINKVDLLEYVRKLDENETKELDKALSIALGLDENYK